jgi:hypothetical protein
VKHFLLIYSVKAGKLVAEPKVFRKPDEAVAAYEAAEGEHRNDKTMQVVLVGAHSLEDVKVTHGNFFRTMTVERMIDELLGDLEAPESVH